MFLLGLYAFSLHPLHYGLVIAVHSHSLTSLRLGIPPSSTYRRSSLLFQTSRKPHMRFLLYIYQFLTCTPSPIFPLTFPFSPPLYLYRKRHLCIVLDSTHLHNGYLFVHFFTTRSEPGSEADDRYGDLQISQIYIKAGPEAPRGATPTDVTRTTRVRNPE